MSHSSLSFAQDSPCAGGFCEHKSPSQKQSSIKRFIGECIKPPCENPTEAEYDDWVCDPCSPLCQGYYREAPIPFPDATPAFLESQPTTITSDKATFLANGDAKFRGNVHLTQGNRQLFANEAQLFRNASTKEMERVDAEGCVRITEPGLRLEGTKAIYYIPEDEKFIENASFRLYRRHARGTASCGTLYQKSRMVLRDVTYTTCKPGQDTWMLRAKKIRMSSETGRGQATHAFLFVENIPIFYLPYIDFPIDDRRKTGFLFPSIGTTTESGKYFSIPFYWNLAPNYDATITTKYYSRRASEFDGQLRYLTRTSSGQIVGAVLPHDRLFEHFRDYNLAYHPQYNNNDPRVRGLATSATRHCLGWKHTTLFNPYLRVNLDYKTVGDDNYLYDLDTPLGVPPNTLQLLRQGEILFNYQHWTAAARLQNYQTTYPFNGPLIAEVYERYPQFTARGSDFAIPLLPFVETNSLECDYPAFPFHLKFDVDSDFTHFAHKVDPFTNQPFTVGDRIHVRPAISYPIRDPGWFIVPRLQYDILSYNVQLSPNDARNNLSSHPNVTTPMYDVDMGLIFEQEFPFQRRLYVQTLEPRAYYLYVPFRNFNSVPNFDTTRVYFDYNQLYRDNRFSGLDRIGDTNQVTLGLTSRFLEDCTGAEQLSLGIGQIYYFKKRLVTSFSPIANQPVYQQELINTERYHSPLAGIATLKFTPVLTGTAQIDWNTHENKAERNFFNLQYRPECLTVYNIGYQFIRRYPNQLNPITLLPEKLEQTEFSFAHQLNEKWRILGRWHYDIINERSTHFLFGFEQQGCCTALRFSVVRELRLNNGLQPALDKKYKTSYLLQFVFKGFAGVGNKSINQTLKRTIPGYEWRGEDY